MPLPDDVELLIRVLRELPQAWLADRALIAAQEVERDLTEEESVSAERRTVLLLLAIARQLDVDLQIMRALPEAMSQALETIGRDGGRRAEVQWVSDDNIELLRPTGNGEVDEFRSALRCYIAGLVSRHDRSAAAELAAELPDGNEPDGAPAP